MFNSDSLQSICKIRVDTQADKRIYLKCEKEVVLMQILAERMRTLRESLKLSQAKVAALAGTTQSSINRYENEIGFPPHKTLLWYADYFDVSMDYIYGRTDKPQGILYEYRPKVEQNSDEMRKFVEMCFDPNSPMNDRLKQTLIDMLEGVKT